MSIMLKLFALISLFLFLSLIYIDRSFWVDESMIYLALKNTTFLELFHPLILFNQAEPISIAIIHKILISLLNEILYIRFALLLIFIALLLLIIGKNLKKIDLLIGLPILIIFSNNLLFYATEFKHYSFEILISIYLLSRVYDFNTNKNYQKFFLSIAIVSFFGYSTLIPIGILFILGVYKLISDNYDFNYKQIIKMIKEKFKILIFSASLIGLSYVLSSYITSRQMEHQAYLEHDLFDSIVDLVYSTYGALGTLGSFLLTISMFYWLIKALFFKIFNMYFVTFSMIIFAVILGKLIGVYPVIYSRHLLWIIPFAISIIYLFIVEIITLSKRYKIKSISLIINIVIISISLFVLGNLVLDKEGVEYADNYELYTIMSMIKNSQIIISYEALPSFLVYNEFINYDKSNNYIYYDWSKDEPLNQIENQNKKWIEQTLELIGKDQVYYFVFSHIDILNTANSNVVKYFDFFRLNDYIYEIIYYGNKTAIIKLRT